MRIAVLLNLIFLQFCYTQRFDCNGPASLCHVDHCVSPVFLARAVSSALSHYPELKEVDIKFKNRNIKTTMQTRPDLKSLFSKGHRQYTVWVDNYCENHNGIVICEVPEHAWTGLIGHELAHIVCFEKMSSKQLAWYGLRYLNRHFHRKFERETDKVAIAHGLGAELLDWSAYVSSASPADDAYRKFKMRYYMHPEEILGEFISGLLQAAHER